VRRSRKNLVEQEKDIPYAAEIVTEANFLRMRKLLEFVLNLWSKEKPKKELS
jgi:hypothetical protein